MNLQLTSNQNLSYRRNTLNDFAVEIKPPIDVRDGDMYILVNEIFYPTTLSNVNKVTEKHYFNFKIIVKNFIKKQYGGLVASAVHFESETVWIPCGFYDAEMLCNILNKQVTQFGMQFTLEKKQDGVTDLHVF